MNNTQGGRSLEKATEVRKNEHIDICLQEDVQGQGITTGFEQYRFVHNALPEINFKDIELVTHFLGKKINAPFLISSMTGGTQRAWEINQLLAEVAEARGWAMGLGSMRAALENEQMAYSFRVRKKAPTIPLIANIGAVQFNYGYGVEECRKAVELVEADALVLHFNSMQEVFQPEGDTNFSQLLPKIEELTASLSVPIGVKEVGWGISASVAKRFIQVGIQFIDVAGAGGTSWSQVERYRTKNVLYQQIAQTFAGWGIPTAECVRSIKARYPEYTCIASGGITNGLEAAKALALGADIVGFGRTLLSPATGSLDDLHVQLEKIELETKIAMFGIGASMISELQKHPSLVHAHTNSFADL